MQLGEPVVGGQDHACGIDVACAVRPLPARLRLDETFETWIPVADVPTEDDLERMVRVQLSNGKVVKSRLNKGVPPTGYIAGPGSS